MNIFGWSTAQVKYGSGEVRLSENFESTRKNHAVCCGGFLLFSTTPQCPRHFNVRIYGILLFLAAHGHSGKFLFQLFAATQRKFFRAPCIRVPKCSAGAPVTARPSRSRQKQNVDPRKLHWFTSNVGIAHLTDHHGWNGGSFSVSCGVHFMTSGFLYTSQSTFSFWDFGLLQPKLHFLQKRQENAIIWSIFVIVTMLLNISCVIWWTITV